MLVLEGVCTVPFCFFGGREVCGNKALYFFIYVSKGHRLPTP